ncbi:MAG: DNRLRE domain-containing protein [Marinisporobacter sp.]|jgi:tetratricopeptide (TPR) repeat protein|nr:DNRLRE domain-containing protein [Marinisporobacter sp.]
MLEIIEKKPFRDAAINSDMPYENYGDYYALFVGKYMNHSVYRSLLYFDLPCLEEAGKVKKVELFLYVARNDCPSIKKEFHVYRIKEGFEESTINYSNQSSIDESFYQTFTINEEMNNYIKVDITRFFNDWYCEKAPNHGLMIKAANENKNLLVAFYSKDHGVDTPKLQIHFERFDEKNQRIIKNSKMKNIKPEILYGLANEYFNNKNYKEAYDCYEGAFDQLIQKQKYGYQLVYRMVLSLKELQLYDKALEMIHKGIGYYPDFTDLIYIKGQIYISQNKTSLAIRTLNECLNRGDSPMYLNYIEGAGSCKAWESLGEIYYELGDYEESYYYCKKAYEKNSQFIKPLYTITKILFHERRDLQDIKEKLENFVGTYLDGKEYIILAEIYLQLRSYKIAYEYIEKAEELIIFSEKDFYRKGMCCLLLKNYKKSYNSFEKIEKGELKEKSIFNRVLCEILSGNMYGAVKLLNEVREPENTKKRKVYYALKNILEGKKYDIISDDQEESKELLDIIFKVLDILIEAASPENFEKALQLLNLVENDGVLLRLAKLYYDHDLYSLAYGEFVRSIKLFDEIDLDGLNMMTKSFAKMSI